MAKSFRDPPRTVGQVAFSEPVWFSSGWDAPGTRATLLSLGAFALLFFCWGGRRLLLWGGSAFALRKPKTRKADGAADDGVCSGTCVLAAAQTEGRGGAFETFVRDAGAAWQGLLPFAASRMEDERPTKALHGCALFICREFRYAEALSLGREIGQAHWKLPRSGSRSPSPAMTQGSRHR